MKTLLELRNQITGILAGLIGTYRFPSGQQVPAIVVLPDPSYGFDYPPSGSIVDGLEVVIIPGFKIDNRPIIGANYVADKTQILLKQWNSQSTTVEATNRLIDFLADETVEVRLRVLPVPQLNNIETCTILLNQISLRDFKN